VTQNATCLRSNCSTLKLDLWLVGAVSAACWTRPPAHPSPYRTEHFRKMLSACSGLGSLLNSSWFTTHMVQLHFVILVRGLLFLWEVCCFQCPFTCLFLKCLSHPKWSHLCHCPTYNIGSTHYHMERWEHSWACSAQDHASSYMSCVRMGKHLG
jgi:hypothetical protein